MRVFTIIMLSLLTFSPQARMYQWDDPDTGRTHLSGKPPTWYRTNAEGPRVFVFEGGRLVDDTGIKVSNDRRQALRREAISGATKSGGQTRFAGQGALEALAPAVGRAAGVPPGLVMPDRLVEPPQLPAFLEQSTDETKKLTPEQAAELRALVSAWETSNKATNQRSIDGLNSAGGTSSKDEQASPPVSREQVLRYLESQSQQADQED